MESSKECEAGVRTAQSLTSPPAAYSEWLWALMKPRNAPSLRNVAYAVGSIELIVDQLIGDRVGLPSIMGCQARHSITPGRQWSNAARIRVTRTGLTMAAEASQSARSGCIAIRRSWLTPARVRRHTTRSNEKTITAIMSQETFGGRFGWTKTGTGGLLALQPIRERLSASKSGPTNLALATDVFSSGLNEAARSRILNHVK